VREELLLIGKALEEAGREVGGAQADHLLVRIDEAAPCAAYARDSTLVSANETSATAQPPTSTGPRSANRSRARRRGQALAAASEHLHPAPAARSNTPTTAVAPTTAISTPGSARRV
jgi:hypothetical protein